MLEAVAHLTAAGAAVVAVTQCVYGHTSLATYAATGQELLAAGALDGGALTTEAALTALHYLMSLDLPAAEIRQVFSPRTRPAPTRRSADSPARP
jgi:L-asparaginase